VVGQQQRNQFIKPAGGQHPYAGFEEVSLWPKSETPDEAFKMKGGGLKLKVAGSSTIQLPFGYRKELDHTFVLLTGFLPF
jgi:hypothetical protein